MVSSGCCVLAPSGVIYPSKWRDDGTFEAVLSRLQLKLREDGLMDLDTWMIDATSVRATRAAAGGGKKGARKNR